MIGRAERMFTSMFGDPSKTASEKNVPVSFVTYNRMLYSPDWNPTPDKNVARKFKEYLKNNIKSKFDSQHTDTVIAYLHTIKKWEKFNDAKELVKRIRLIVKIKPAKAKSSRKKKVYTGPNGGKYVIRNGEKKYKTVKAA